MNRQKLLKLTMIGLASFALSLSACGALPSPTPTPTLPLPTPTLPLPTPTLPTPTPTPSPIAQVGHWETVGEAISPVSFDVTEQGKIVNFNILVDGDCDVMEKVAISISSDNTFVIGSVDAEGQPETNGIVGTFDTPTTASGSIGSKWECSIPSGGVMIMFLPSQLTTWTAEWQEP